MDWISQEYAQPNFNYLKRYTLETLILYQVFKNSVSLRSKSQKRLLSTLEIDLSSHPQSSSRSSHSSPFLLSVSPFHLTPKSGCGSHYYVIDDVKWRYSLYVTLTTKTSIILNNYQFQPLRGGVGSEITFNVIDITFWPWLSKTPLIV